MGGTEEGEQEAGLLTAKGRREIQAEQEDNAEQRPQCRIECGIMSS